MIFLSSLLFAFAVASALWIGARHYQNGRLASMKIQTVSGGMSFPYSFQAANARRGEELTLDTLENDKIARDLFLSGSSSRKTLNFFRMILKLSLILPAGILLLHAMMGSLTLKTVLFAAAAGGFFYFYVRLIIRARKQRRQRALLRSLPQFLDLLLVCVEAGLSFPAAIERLTKEADAKDPLRKEFSTMYHEFLGGFSLAQACERLARRCEVPDLSLLLSSIVQSDQMGAGLGGTLRVQARELRDKFRQRMRGRALQIPVKILFPMMFIFVSLFTMTLGPAFYQLSAAMGSNYKHAESLSKEY